MRYSGRPRTQHTQPTLPNPRVYNRRLLFTFVLTGPTPLFMSAAPTRLPPYAIASAGAAARHAKLTEEGFREIEDQRDALHKALKLLINRYERQQKEHERAVKKLTSAKNRAEHATPNRTVYHKEVAFLKDEVSTLRKRTEDALEQKWQYEKGLSGIKMDLDRSSVVKPKSIS